MALSGDLKDFGLHQLLTLIQVTAKGGALTLQRPGETAILYFENGLLTKVHRQGTPSDGLVQALYRAGQIRQDHYQQFISQSLPSEQAAALLLVDQGILSQEAVMDFVRERSLSELYCLVTWSEGAFQLDVNAVPPEGDILTPTELGPVLDKARGYMEEWQILVARIPDLEKGLRLLSEPSHKIQEIRLDLTEWRMVAALAKDCTLKEIGQQLGLNELATRQVAYRLISAGLADVVEREPALPDPTPSPEPVPPATAEQTKRGGFGLFGARGNR